MFFLLLFNANVFYANVFFFFFFFGANVFLCKRFFLLLFCKRFRAQVYRADTRAGVCLRRCLKSESWVGCVYLWKYLEVIITFMVITFVQVYICTRNRHTASL